ncbi:MAG: MOSC domain-containing protein [Thiobacillaceae bacterium]|jgi:MOSC domain-containing protein YiiM|nr:MOSC domain-containing protein [Thiobacillaceae bacterium]
MSDLPELCIPLLALNAGRVRPLGREGLPSGIDKRPVEGALRIGLTGLAGDEQADRQHHGGPDKALHHYPAEHYDRWRAELPDRAALFHIGGFGENLSTRGLTEESACLGDVWRLGGAVLQISQGRQPCRRLDLRFDRPDMVARVRESGRSGWYYRVVEEGAAGPGDVLVLLERPHPEWPLDRLARVLFGAQRDRAALGILAGLPRLSAGWRERAARRLIESGPD